MSHLVEYVRRFGLVDGARLYFATKLLRRGAVARVRVPGLRAPVLVRGGSFDRTVFRKIFVSREYDPPDTLPALATLIIDGGANVGYSSIFFAQQYPGATVIAVEPDEANFAALRLNAAPYANIVPVHAALWGSPGHVHLAAEASWSGHAEAAHGNATDVRACTVGELVASAGGGRLSILKLDIEGAESSVFAATDLAWLEQTDCLMIELHEWWTPGSSASFERAMAGRPFARSRFGENDVLIRVGSAPAPQHPTQEPESS